MADVFGEPQLEMSPFSFRNLKNNIEEKNNFSQMRDSPKFWGVMKTLTIALTHILLKRNLRTGVDNLIKATQLLLGPQSETGLCTVLFKTKQNNNKLFNACFFLFSLKKKKV